MLLYYYIIVIEELISDPDAKEFINFVDKKRFPDYDKKIYYPMCLNEITARINRSQCDTREKVLVSYYLVYSSGDIAKLLTVN